jgi:hypothetical protein
MSLAMFAAPFNDNSNIESTTDDSNNIMNQKRQTHNKTQKRYPKENFDTEKVNSVLEKIHSNSKTNDDETEMGVFNPPPKPQSSGVNKTVATENMMNMTNKNSMMLNTLGRAPQPNYENGDNLDLNDYNNYGNNKSVEEYYKRVLPGYNQIPGNTSNRNPVNRPYYNVANTGPETSNQDVLLQKLNYMISLLEDQHDEKTNNVTEEVVLYSFLGIFIIFVVDSFARAGKYVR